MDASDAEIQELQRQLSLVLGSLHRAALATARGRGGCRCSRCRRCRCYFGNRLVRSWWHGTHDSRVVLFFILIGSSVSSRKTATNSIVSIPATEKTWKDHGIQCFLQLQRGLGTGGPLASTAAEHPACMRRCSMCSWNLHRKQDRKCDGESWWNMVLTFLTQLGKQVGTNVANHVQVSVKIQPKTWWSCYSWLSWPWLQTQSQVNYISTLCNAQCTSQGIQRRITHALYPRTQQNSRNALALSKWSPPNRLLSLFHS